MRRGVAAAAALIVPATAATEAEAQRITVQNTKASGSGSFKAALKRSNRDRDRDKITFRSRLTGSIKIRPGAAISRPVRIVDGGHRRVTLTGPRRGRALRVATDQSTDGKPSRIQGLRLRRVSLGVASYEPDFELWDAALSGDGIRSNGASVEDYAGLDMRSTSVQGFEGDGLHVESGGDADVSNSTIRDNARRGIAVSLGRVNLKRSTISGNAGGGLRSFSYGFIRAENSTLNGNGRPGSLRAINAYAGYNSGIVLDATTLADDRTSAAGSHLGTGYEGGIAVHNSIVAGAPACAGSPNVISQGGNVIENPGACTQFSSDLIADPLLGPLVENGGATRTRALREGSPAIGYAITPYTQRDQRGRDRDGSPDSGSFERGAR